MLRVRPVPALGQQQLPQLPQLPQVQAAADSFLATPVGKVVTAGAIGVAAAKAFPGKTVGPFMLSAFIALATGLVPEIGRTP